MSTLPNRGALAAPAGGGTMRGRAAKAVRARESVSSQEIFAKIGAVRPVLKVGSAQRKMFALATNSARVPLAPRSLGGHACVKHEGMAF